ncbi:MAG: peptidoglycan DD-metalloendopeptidase family protein [Clostridia bacterium]|nr:peptidoglycan DD-metalloendopeptidase family protein [Clostridia bacterium]
MKQSKNQRKKQKQNSKGSYIKVGLALFAGGVALIALFRMSTITQNMKEESPLSLPAPVPYETASPKTKRPQSVPPATVLPTQTPNETIMPEKIEEPEQPTALMASAPQTTPPELIWPIESDIITPFSQDKLIKSKTMGDWRVHEGVDLKAEGGTEVRAAGDGVIERAYQDSQMGFTIIIDHGGGYKSVYQNLASVEMVKEGECVTKGRGIAAVGNSASAEMLDAAHLHFAVMAGEAYQNPEDLIS